MLLVSLAEHARTVTSAQDFPVPVAGDHRVDWAIALLAVTCSPMIFRVLPDVVPGWRDAAGRLLSPRCCSRSGRADRHLPVDHRDRPLYGAAGSLVPLLLWVNYSLILLFGAAFTRAYLEARGRGAPARHGGAGASAADRATDTATPVGAAAFSCAAAAAF